MTAAATAADGVPRCDWSTVCRLWPGHRLVRVQHRDAPVEHVAVCDDHLPYAQAKGYTRPVPTRRGPGRTGAGRQR